MIFSLARKEGDSAEDFSAFSTKFPFEPGFDVGIWSISQISKYA